MTSHQMYIFKNHCATICATIPGLTIFTLPYIFEHYKKLANSRITRNKLKPPFPRTVAVMYGTDTGMSEGHARDFAIILRSTALNWGIRLVVNVMPMNDYRLLETRSPNVIVIITSTIRESAPPTAVDFEKKMRTNNFSLGGCNKISILGIGDGNFGRPCAFAKDVAMVLSAKRFHHLHRPFYVDLQIHDEERITNWYSIAITALFHELVPH